MRQLLSLDVILLVAGLALLAAAAASAANSPTFRDCSFSGGLDPDFVRLSGVTIGSGGQLTVPASQPSVSVEASESSDPGDSSGHDTLNVTVTTANAAPRTVSGAGTGHVTLTVPLSGGVAGGTYTLNWAATFDNGFHSCPGKQTPQNSSAMPFVLNIDAAGAQVPPTITDLVQAHRVWRLKGKAKHGKHPVGTKFSFMLNEQATVKLVFTQTGKPGSKHRGTLTFSGQAGPNTIRFTGATSSGKRLVPGHYRVKILATTRSGQTSAPKTLKFTIAK